MAKKTEINVFVPAGSFTPHDQNMLKEAEKLGEFLGKNGYTYVQGLNKNGLMGATYNGFVKYSDKIKYHMWSLFGDCKELVGIRYMHNNLNDRLEGFFKDTDIVIVLPGGNGTMHEFVTFLEHSRYYRTHYKIILVNYKGFYNGFLHQISKQIKEGLFPEYEFEKVVTVVKNVDEAISQIPPLSRFNKGN